MDSAAIAEMARLEDHHWWFVGKRLLVAALLEDRLGAGTPRVLDVGCGTGGVLAALPPRARAVGVERSRDAIAHCRRRGVAALACADGDRLPLRAGSIDAVLMMDVLEHFADEAAILGGVRRVLRPDGLLLVSVPAYQFLWSGHDEVLHHVRRYTARRLRRALEDNGFAVERVTYTNTVPLLPAVVVRGLLGRFRRGNEAGTDFRTHASWVNALLTAGYRAEAWAVRRVSLPCGLSVAAVARPGAAR
jgi:SAM-dependent methyltransferase